MNRYLLLLLVILGLTSCTVKDEDYYRSNPKELEKAIKACPSQQPHGLTCQKVEDLGRRMNSLAYQLQYNPQGFGSKILKLQQLMVSQQAELEKNRLDKNGTVIKLETSLNQNKLDLSERLAVVKWMESPAS